MNRSDQQDVPTARRGKVDWRLRWAAKDDLDGLHAVACQTAVYRYLFDGTPPAEELILGMIEQSLADAERFGVGLLILEAPRVRHGGCVRTKPDISSRSAELTYLLDPAHWGQGLATRMGWTAITQAFGNEQIDCVFAGADLPNRASIAVMGRLGMSFRRHVQYPLGPGIDYAIHRGDPAPSPVPTLLPIA